MFKLIFNSLSVSSYTHCFFEPTNPILGLINVAIISLLSSFTLLSQKSYPIPSDLNKVDGLSMKILPGDTIWLAPGQRDALSFHNLTGSPEKPIVILNDQGPVVVNTKKDYGISFSNCVHFHLTGTGGDQQYGIEIAGTNSQGVWIGEFSSFAEVDHIKIHDVGFAGIMAKTDPNCTRRDLRFFIMEHLNFHDNYIYETGGEAFYVGYSWFPTRTFQCDSDSLLYSHEIRGVRIYNNQIKNTHWDGLQVGSSTHDVKLYNNHIFNYGLDDKQWQNHGVQIGAGTTGDFFNNIVQEGPGAGISFFGRGDNRLFNNLLIDNGEAAIYHNDKGAWKGATYQIINNTIVRPEEVGIWLNAELTTDNLVLNNLIILSDQDREAIRNPTDKWTISNNLALREAETSPFIDDKKEDYRLQEEASALDAGTQIPWLKHDFNFAPRPVGESFDIGALEGLSEEHPALKYPFSDKWNSRMKMEGRPIGNFYKIPYPPGFGTKSYILYDEAGILLAKDSLSKPDQSIDFRAYKSGVYHLSLLSDDSPVMTIRLVHDQP